MTRFAPSCPFCQAERKSAAVMIVGKKMEDDHATHIAHHEQNKYRSAEYIKSLKERKKREDERYIP